MICKPQHEMGAWGV